MTPEQRLIAAIRAMTDLDVLGVLGPDGTIRNERGAWTILHALATAQHDYFRAGEDGARVSAWTVSETALGDTEE